MKKLIPFAALFLAALPFAATAQTPAKPPAQPQAQPQAQQPQAPTMQFDQLRAIKNWRKGNDRVVYVQESGGQWYKAQLYEACMKLDPKDGIQFLTETDSVSNEKVSKVELAHHICLVLSITKSDEPPPAK